MLRAEFGAARPGDSGPRLAKISAPRITGWFQRQRLYRRLDDVRRASRVAWVSAPAGSGKTYLLASYLAEGGLASLCTRSMPATAIPRRSSTTSA